jgi:hypothetical protein
LLGGLAWGGAFRCVQRFFVPEHRRSGSQTTHELGSSLPVRSRCEVDVDLFVRQLSRDRLLSHDTVDDYLHALDGHDLVPDHDLFFMEDHVDDAVPTIERRHLAGRFFARTDGFTHYPEFFTTDCHCDRSFLGDDDLMDSNTLDGNRDRVNLELLLGSDHFDRCVCAHVSSPVVGCRVGAYVSGTAEAERQND